MEWVLYKKKGSPAHWAIQGASAEAMRLLLERGPDIDALDDEGISVRDRLKESDLSSTINPCQLSRIILGYSKLVICPFNCKETAISYLSVFYLP